MKDALLAAVITALAVALILVAGSGDDAADEREARLARVAYAQGFEAGRDSVDAAVQAERDSLQAEARADSIKAAEANERARVDVANARAQADRMREAMTTEQRAELDVLTGFYEIALAEKDTVIARTESRLALARGEIAALESFARRETARADAWKDAFDAAEAEIDALRKPSLLPDVGDIPMLAITAGAVLLIAR